MEDGQVASASESEPEHVPLSAAEARRTLNKGGKKDPEVGIEAVAKRQKREKEKAAKASRAPKGKKKVMKERTFTNEKGRTGEFRSSAPSACYDGSISSLPSFSPVTEDYWSFESAPEGDANDTAEDEIEAKPPKKVKTVPKKSSTQADSQESATTSKAKARASSARDTDTEDDIGPPKTKRKSEAAPSIPAPEEKKVPAARPKPAAPPSKKPGQSTLAGFFKK